MFGGKKTQDLQGLQKILKDCKGGNQTTLICKWRRREAKNYREKRSQPPPSSVQMFWSEAALSQERREFVNDPWGFNVKQD